MDYEKAYKDALERARKWYNETEQDSYTCIVESIFPELAESEDERIRKWIINDIRYNMDNETLENSEYKKQGEKAIAWLKKQAEQKPIETTWKPSEEQIRAIRLARSFVVDDFDEHPTLSEILMELEEQLQKIKENKL